MDKIKLKLPSTKVLVGVIAAALLLGAGVVKASYSFNWADVKHEVAQIIAAKVEAPVMGVESEPTFGAVSTLTNAGPEYCVGTYCRYTVSGSFVDASTTIVSVASPYRKATSTSEVVIFTDDTGTKFTSATTSIEDFMFTIPNSTVATTTFGIKCGPATARGTAPTIVMVSTTSNIATSSPGVFKMGAYVAQGNIADVASNTPRGYLSGTYPYFNCTLVSSATVDTGAFTGTGNQFDGRFMLELEIVK